MHPPCMYAHVHPHAYGTCMACMHTGAIREYLMGISGLSSKSVACARMRSHRLITSPSSPLMWCTDMCTRACRCLLLYRMGRVDFAVDANVLRVMTRLGWLKRIGMYATFIN